MTCWFQISIELKSQGKKLNLNEALADCTDAAVTQTALSKTGCVI